MSEPTMPGASRTTGPGAGPYLVDAGEGRRLEQLGDRLVDRPAAAAIGSLRVPGRWPAADLRFDAGDGWWSPNGRRDSSESWTVLVDGLTMQLRPTESGGVGLYPEHAANLPWLEARVAARLLAGSDAPPSVLNLFAHTGLATLALARAGAAVAHVDGARGVVAWARRNAAASRLVDAPVRWLVDDAVAFTRREARRGRRYDGVVVDPPSFGRGGSGARWTLRDDLPALLAACAAVLAPDGFVLLTSHSVGVTPEWLADSLAGATRAARHPETVPLRLVAESGVELDLGWAARLDLADRAP